MKKLLAILLTASLLATQVPVLSAQTETVQKTGYNTVAVTTVGKLLQNGILQKYINSESYAYWNFYISSDSHLASAYAYRYADAVSHWDFMKAVRLDKITKEDAQTVLKDYMRAYLAKSSQKYADMLRLEQLCSLAGYAETVTSLSVEGVQKLTSPQISAIKKELNDVVSNKSAFENALNSGELDSTTAEWADRKYRDLCKQLNLLGVDQDEMEALSDTAIALNWGMKAESAAIRWEKTYTGKIEAALEGCFATQDCYDFFDLIATTAIDGNVRAAAVECEQELSAFQGKTPDQCFRAAKGNAAGEFTVQTFLDFAGTKAEDQLEEMVPMLKAVHTGVDVANVLSHMDSTIEQVNKIRVMAVVSVALTDRVSQSELDFATNWNNVSAKGEAASDLLEYVPMLLLARELGEEQYYNMRQEAGSGVLSKFLSFFRNNTVTLETWHRQTVSDFAQMRARVEGITSGAGESSSAVSNAEKEKIRTYLRNIADFSQGSMPPFDDIADIDKVWVVSSLWLKVPAQAQTNTVYGGVPLAAIEKEARRDINPAVSLPATGDYSYFGGPKASWPKWVPAQKLFTFPSMGYSPTLWDYPITSVIKSGNLYKVICAETYYLEEKMVMNPNTILFCNGREVGSVKGGGGDVPPDFHYSTDPATLPQIQFLLEPSGSGGYFVTAKAGAQSQCEFPSDSPAGSSGSPGGSSVGSGSEKPAGNSLENGLTQDQALNLAVEYYRKTFHDNSDLNTSVDSKDDQIYNGEACCLVKIQKGPKNQKQTLALFLVGIQSGNLYQKDAASGQYRQVPTVSRGEQSGTDGSASSNSAAEKNSSSSGDITLELACRMVTSHCKSTLQVGAHTETQCNGKETYNGEECYKVEFRESKGNQSLTVGVFLVGIHSWNLYEQDTVTKKYKKVTP